MQWDASGNPITDGSTLTSNNPFGAISGSGLMNGPQQTGVQGYGTIPLNPAYYATPDAANTLAQTLGGTVSNANYNTAPGSNSPTQAMVNLPNGTSDNAGNLLNILQNPVWQGNQGIQHQQILQSLNNNYSNGPTNQAKGLYSFDQTGKLVYDPNGQAPQAGAYGAWAGPTGANTLSTPSNTGYAVPTALNGGGSLPQLTQGLGNIPPGSPVGYQPGPGGQPGQQSGQPGSVQQPNYYGNQGGMAQNPYQQQGGQPGSQGQPFNPQAGGLNNSNPLQQNQLNAAFQGFTPGQGGADSYPSYLQNVINNGGNPIDQTSAWQAMVSAQQRNIQEGAANLAEQFNVSGDRFSSAFGTAATDYQNQATMNQNALLGQMTATAGENAANRLYGASGQLSGQDFQSQMQQYGMSGQMAQLLAGQSGQAAMQLAQLGGGAANTMYGGSITGAQGLFGGENQGANSMFGAQNSSLPAFMQSDQFAQSLGLQSAAQLSQLWNQNLQTGGQLGQQQYSQQQNAISNAYQEYLRTQPQSNPLLQMMYSAATTYPTFMSPGYAPGALGGIMQGAGSLAGGAASLAMLSDERLKTDIHQIGEIGGLPFYKFKFKGSDVQQMGFMAQEVGEKYPSAVYEGGEDPYKEPWMINVGNLLKSFQELN